MYTMNQLTLIGFTGQDAQTHYTQRKTCGHALGRHQGIVEGRRRCLAEPNHLASGGPVRRASRICRGAREGSLVLVQGAVRSREYEKDGLKHRVFEVRAETIGKLDRAERQATPEPDIAD